MYIIISFFIGFNIPGIVIVLVFYSIFNEIILQEYWILISWYFTFLISSSLQFCFQLSPVVYLKIRRTLHSARVTSLVIRFLYTMKAISEFQGRDRWLWSSDNEVKCVDRELNKLHKSFFPNELVTQRLQIC